MSLNPKAREAFATVELAYYAEHPEAEIASFDSAGCVSWASCSSPETLQQRSFVKMTYDTGPELESSVGEDRRVTWEPSKCAPSRIEALIAEAGPRLVQLIKFFELLDIGREPYRKRAERHIPEWDLGSSLEYGTYYLYTRGRCHPYSKAEFKGLRTALKKRVRARVKKARQRSRHRSVVPPQDPQSEEQYAPEIGDT